MNKFNFYLEDKDVKQLKVELKYDEDTVDLYINGECVGYFDDDGLNLLSECEKLPEELLDERGMLKIHKHGG